MISDFGGSTFEVIAVMNRIGEILVKLIGIFAMENESASNSGILVSFSSYIERSVRLKNSVKTNINAKIHMITKAEIMRAILRGFRGTLCPPLFLSSIFIYRALLLC